LRSSCRTLAALLALTSPDQWTLVSHRVGTDPLGAPMLPHKRPLGMTTTLLRFVRGRPFPSQEAGRMTETTGFEAKTIHRLLEVDPKTGGFRRGEDSPLDCDLLIVDETVRSSAGPSRLPSPSDFSWGPTRPRPRIRPAADDGVVRGIVFAVRRKAAVKLILRTRSSSSRWAKARSRCAPAS
jgi:hypothetical protein